MKPLPVSTRYIRVEDEIGDAGGIQDILPGEYWDRFCEAMDDDINTARGIGVLFIAVREINRALDLQKKPFSNEAKARIESGRADILNIGSLLGILSEPPEVYFEKKKSQVLEKQSIDPVAIDRMINDRAAARKSKDWKKADQVRTDLEKINIILEDRSDGSTVWKINK
ncbi:DALR domain-containing protein [Thermodesulfobacteriota bacterium]